MWQRYYMRWKDATRERLDPALVDLLPALAKLCPPAAVLDKTFYSAFSDPQLLQLLQAREADGLITLKQHRTAALASGPRGLYVVPLRRARMTSPYRIERDRGTKEYRHLRTDTYCGLRAAASSANLISCTTCWTNGSRPRCGRASKGDVPLSASLMMP